MPRMGLNYTKQGNFASSKQQCEYSKSLLQENFKRLALCHPDIIESEGLKPSSFINDIENIVPMKHKKFNEIYAETGKLIIEDPAQNFFRKRKYDPKYGIEVALDGESLTEQQLIEPDISLNYLKNMLVEIVNVEMVKTDNIHDANILFHLKTFTFGTGAEAHRDLVFFDQHKTKIAFLEGYLSKDIINWTDARDFQEAWHLLGHVFFDHPGDNNMIDNIDRERIYHRCGTVMEECSSFTPITLMPDDILALHHMYTANTNTRADDTVYTIKSDQTYINGDKPYLPYAIPKNSIYTLYDAGGKNTLDVTYMKNDSVTIDLNEGPGHLNKIGDNQFFLAFGTNIHKIKLSGVNSIVNMHSSVGCEIIVRETYNAKITNFHIDQDKVFFQEGFVLSQREDGFTAYSLLGDVIADIYYA